MMFKFSAITVFMQLSLAYAVALDQTPAPGKLSAIATAALRQRVEEAGGCHADVCFAIDGGRTISPLQFAEAKNFVKDVISVLSTDPHKIAAVQFAGSARIISGLTANDLTIFSAIGSERQLGGRSVADRGLRSCLSLLGQGKQKAKKIIFLGNSNITIGRTAIARADTFKLLGGDICAVNVGDGDGQGLLRITGGDRDKVFDSGNFFDVLDVQLNLLGLVEMICKH